MISNKEAKNLLNTLIKTISKDRTEKKHKGLSNNQLKALIKSMLKEDSFYAWTEEDWALEYAICIDKVLKALEQLKNEGLNVDEEISKYKESLGIRD